mgnify:CR=1 FL=1
MKELIISTSDNYALAATLFQSKNNSVNNKILIINSATGIKQNYYFKFANYLSESGFNVITYDWRDNHRYD